MTRLVFDPHIHLFAYEQGDYAWLKNQGPPLLPAKKAIQRDFGQADLALSDTMRLAGACHIEAGFDNAKPEAELQWLAKQSFNGVAIGYAQIDAPTECFQQQLKQLRQPMLRGIRDITEGDDGMRLLSPNVLKNLSALSDADLIWEAQFEVSNAQLTQTVLSYAKQLPQLKIVINHCGLLNTQNFAQGIEQLAELAKLGNVYIKCSGWELNFAHQGAEIKQMLIDTVLKLFPTHRVMLASNFPLCLFEQSYEQLWLDYESVLSSYDAHVQHQLMASNAMRIYRVE